MFKFKKKDYFDVRCVDFKRLLDCRVENVFLHVKQYAMLNDFRVLHTQYTQYMALTVVKLE